MSAQVRTKPVEEVIAAIEALDLGAIKFKLMQADEGEGWTRETVDRVEMDYKRFLTLHAKYPDTTIAPSSEMDKFWHAHILDTMKYAEDCERTFGYFLHHFPYLGLRGEEDAAAQQQADQETRALFATEFGESTATAAYCAIAKPSYCAVQAEAAYCAASKPSYCAVQSKAAYCAVSKPAYCAVAKAVKTAYCAVASKTAYCAVASKTAYCAVASKPAYCAVASKAAYCAASRKEASDAAYCAAQKAYCAASKRADLVTRPTLEAVAA